MEFLIIDRGHEAGKDDGSMYSEVVRRELGGGRVLSAGFVSGTSAPEDDTIYVMLERERTLLLVLSLRSDEAQALVWVLSGLLWSRPDHDAGQRDTDDAPPAE